MNKILYVTPGCFDKGGISRYNRYQIKCIRELFGENNVRVISLFGPDQNEIEEPFQVYWHGITNSFLDKTRFTYIIFKTIIFWKPKLILIAHVNFSGVIVFFAKLFGIRTILNIYGFEVWSGMTLDAKIGLKRSDFIISDCHYTANYVKETHRIKSNLEVIWDCVDLYKFRYDESGFEYLKVRYNLPDRNKYFLVLTLGRMALNTEYKGYLRLIDVLAIVLKKEKGVKLIMAGSGDLTEAIIERARTLGVDVNVTMTGSIEEKDIAAMYSYCHLFSLVTESGNEMGEGIPLTPLEAMACRSPIIVGNQDGSSEAVFENQNGFVIDPWDLNAHAAIICKLMDQPELLEKMTVSAEQTAKQHFSYELFKSKHQAFFKRMASTP